MPVDSQNVSSSPLPSLIFLLPIMFGALVDLTGVRSSCFMLMYGVVWVSLIWMYWTEVKSRNVMNVDRSLANTLE